jgi:F-type H+-transporting ATPase subunit delta
MAGITTHARPYARAAFELGTAANALPEWQRKLEFAAAVAGNRQAAALIGNPNVDAEDLKALFLPQGEPADGAFAGFLAMLAENRRLSLLPEIAQLFGALKREHEQVLRVTVRAAVPVEPAQAEALKAALKRRFNRDIELTTAIDESVIGGAVIDAGDVVIDGSVRGRLARLESALVH